MKIKSLILKSALLVSFFLGGSLYSQDKIDEEKKAYAELKKKVEDFGKTAKRVNDGRTREFKKTTKAAEDFGSSIASKVTNAFNDLDKGQQKVFADATPQGLACFIIATPWFLLKDLNIDKAAKISL